MPSPSRMRSPSSTRVTLARSPPRKISNSARASSFAARKSTRKPSENY